MFSCWISCSKDRAVTGAYKSFSLLLLISLLAWQIKRLNTCQDRSVEYWSVARSYSLIWINSLILSNILVDSAASTTQTDGIICLKEEIQPQTDFTMISQSFWTVKTMSTNTHICPPKLQITSSWTYITTRLCSLFQINWIHASKYIFCVNYYICIVFIWMLGFEKEFLYTQHGGCPKHCSFVHRWASQYLDITSYCDIRLDMVMLSQFWESSVLPILIPLDTI